MSPARLNEFKRNVHPYFGTGDDCLTHVRFLLRLVLDLRWVKMRLSESPPHVPLGAPCLETVDDPKIKGLGSNRAAARTAPQHAGCLGLAMIRDFHEEALDACGNNA